MNARKYVSWINKIPKEEKIVNLFIDYETFGEHQKSDTGIFKFLKALPSAVFAKSGIEFLTPSQVIAQHKPISTLHVPYPVSAVDEEGDLNAWLGNDLQQDAFDKLYALSEKIDQYTDTDLLNDWQYLQTSDHFYYMSTKYFTDGGECSSFNPYNSPYDAFVNYMNILNDFTLRLNRNIEINHFNLVELKQKVFSRFNSNSGYISENKS